MGPKKNHLTLNQALSCTLTLFTLASCAGPESYQQKMARYTPKTLGKNQVPDIKTADIKFTETKTSGRTPASAPENPNRIGDETKTKESSSENMRESGPTNKKLYFLALYSEYETLKKYSPDFAGPSVNICPNFHTSLLQHNQNAVSSSSHSGIPKAKKFSYDSKKFSDEYYVAARPELLLPLSKEEVTPKVIDVIKSSNSSMNEFAINELVHKALDIHLAKTYSEIRELCEYGVSDNYYIYENLITHIKNNKFEAGSQNMNTLLKTTIFSNIALITSFDRAAESSSQGRSIASIGGESKKSAYTSEVMARLNVNWASQYFEFIKVSR